MKPRLFLIIGNFGVGKTSVVNYYEAKPVTDFLVEINGCYGLGGKHGADSLSGKGYPKKRAFEEIIAKYIDKDMIVHSVFYQAKLDIERYQRTHELIVIYLDTWFHVNEKRMASRGGSLKKRAFMQESKSLEDFFQYCQFKKVRCYRVDNNRELPLVASEVWGIIKTKTNKQPSDN